MKRVSILNNVIGPVMRGPSSSHTAGPWRIGRVLRDLLGSEPQEARIVMDPSSSIGVCYETQGSHLAMLAGLLDLPLTDLRFHDLVRLAPRMGFRAHFELAPFPEADHPNSVLFHLKGRGGEILTAHGRSVGGGSMEIASLDRFPVMITGDRYHLLVEAPAEHADLACQALSSWDREPSLACVQDRCLVQASSHSAPPGELMGYVVVLAEQEGWLVRSCGPVMYPLAGEELCSDAAGLVSLALERGLSLGQAALLSESSLLGIPIEELDREMEGRLRVMIRSVEDGFRIESPMRLIRPFAGGLLEAHREGRFPIGGPHLMAALRAAAAMHVNSSGGVVCAAPTGGSAGVLPGVLVTLLEDLDVPREMVLRGLWAAGAVGQCLDRVSTFAAEACGCQVEIGAAGAMAAAAVVEALGGTPKRACDAAATVFQNVMGSVCDLVQGVVEVPCHSRNAALASMALLCADLVMGGYESPVPLDETLWAVDQVGRMLPPELRCTSRGGLALCPSAMALGVDDRLRKV
ncbi:serine dehydratase alpha chain [Thermanaerovibrio acidaminovorans DSM 6589]|uniref:L-serine ammonia-lyase n=1 Tax=Thermanaerovibrio acidaminovorans (strain ATCC 49978 / DSM 6589 / Su883) TaxID=525903 RepID=D1B6X8_THEAS|nr:L-serine ammonia-lyase, iron-sulfur-dependent, subunit alpha [Thermanaerovibrio acidaminovorans]ACZ19769.1 serine dehydratase alpha chain [Thermanaerovibrio acidaminovorans DSM 6589]